MTHLLKISPKELAAFEKEELSFVITKNNRAFQKDDEVILESESEAKQLRGTISYLFNGETSGLRKDWVAMAVKIKKDEQK